MPDVHGIELLGLEKSYSTSSGTIRAVRGIDVEVAAGETVALLGPNGAGKSTAIDMLLGLQKPDRGTVAVFGETPAEAVKHGRIGAMLQTGGLLQYLSVRELVSMMAALYPTPLPVDETLQIAQVADLADRRTDKLSGGQTQRVRFAVALISNPDLLVLDEPTVGMDVEARHAFWGTVRAFADRGKTVLFATHYLGSRTIRATLPDADLASLEALAGVTRAERRGESVSLVCADSDAAIRALLAAEPQARDIEIAGAGLEEAFLQLTGDADGEDEAAP
jgi:ABC-2 type transport system ATP-binding protein